MTEIAPAPLEWQDIVPLPVVIDADVLSRSVDYAIRTGWTPAAVRHASPSYTTFTGITLFATERVIEETFGRFGEIARVRNVSVADVERTWDDLFCSRVRVVDVSGIRVDDPRVDDVALRDPEDAPTASLAVLLAPCALLTDNWSHFQAFRAKEPHPTRTEMDATTAYALDVRDLGEFLQMLNAGTLPPRLAGLAVFEGGKALVRWAGRDVALAVALLLLGGATLYMSTEGGRRVRDAAVEAAKQLAAVHGPAIGAVFEAGIATAERLSAFAVQPGATTPMSIVARQLSHRGVMTTAEIADHLVWSGYRYTPATSHPKRVRAWLVTQACFWESQRGRWTLGYHEAPRR